VKVEGGRAEDAALWNSLVAPWKAAAPAVTYKPAGCLECRMTGFIGRIGIYETLVCSPGVKGAISAGGDLARLREQALKEGMKPLRVSGALKVASGLTTIDEVLKTAPPSRES
jgi:general secretion pathway protein E